MNHCPHCGAELSKNARFCPHCMTSLIEKRVIPTPKYPPLRWLSAIAAVLVLCASVWSGLHLWPQEAQDADAILQPTTTVTTATPATTTATTTTAPIIAPTQTTTAENIATTLTTATDTSMPTTTAPATTQTTTATKERPSTTTVKPTTTKATTTTTKPVPTYPASWDEQGPYYTEDGQVFEDVGWTYQSAGNSIKALNSEPFGYLTFTETDLYGIPFSECIIVTGFKNIASNGCYRIPPTIDGKVVVAVDMRQPVDGAHQFNDEDVALTVRSIAFPPELILVYENTFNLCENIEHAYFTSSRLLMYPSAVPTNTGVNHSNSLAMHAYRTYMLYDPYAGEYAILKNYCEYIVTPGVNITCGDRMHYPGVYWWPTDLDYFNSLYPDWWTTKHG